MKIRQDGDVIWCDGTWDRGGWDPHYHRSYIPLYFDDRVLFSELRKCIANF